MKVVKRNGSLEDVSFDKVLLRIQLAAKDLEVNPTLIAQRTLLRIYDGVKTTELDELAAQLSISLMTTNPDYGILASRIAISNHHRNTTDKFTDVVFELSKQTVEKTGEVISNVSEELVELCKTHGDVINAKIDYQRDYELDYFGFKTLEKLQYLLRDTKGRTLERPQHLMMRVSLALWGSVDLEKAFETYDMLSKKYFIHATPTNFNAGTPRQQLSSCFLQSMKADSIVGIYDTLKDCAMISKFAGGIGLHIHDIRAKGSLIRGTNGTSNGIVPMLRNFNDTARYVDQCFTPDTLVYTQSGPKPIEDIGVGDLVMCSDGTYQKVKMPIRHEYAGKILELTIKNSIYPVRLTPEHQVFALQGQAKGLNYDVIRNRLDKNITKADFVDAKDLKESDFLVFPIPSYIQDIEELSEEDCRFYGILIGDGHISSTTSGVSLNNDSKQLTLQFVKDYLNNRSVKIYEYTEENCVSIKWSNASPRFKFTKSQLYDSDGTKKWDTTMLHLPLKKTIQIIRGIIETDGCIGEKEITVELTSSSIIESIRYSMMRFGALTSGYTRNRVGNVSTYKNITTRLPTFVIRIPRIEQIMEMFPNAPNGEFFSYLTHNNYMYSRITNIDDVKYDGIVHDFEIDGPHDYTVAHLGIAHNGGGKRNGSFAIYLEPWHADVEDFLKLKLNTGSEEERCRDLFYALWVPDLFMERVEKNEPWTLFCPSEAPGLADVYGDEFRALYTRYEQEGRGRKQVDAQKLWFKVLDSQIETGTPYLLYKDACNQKSNQKNLGTIKSSNLCTEIVEYSSPEETAVCNLASLALPSYVQPKTRTFDFKKLRDAVKIVIKNLNRVIDINYYPTPETKTSNTRHRPVGLGVQGLADVFALLRVPWESEKAAELNQLIFEHIYYAAVESSCEIAEKEGPYSTFEGSPMSQGIFQYDMWNVTPLTANEGRIQWTNLSEEKDQTLPWQELKERVKKHGVRNSLLLAPMPTASTSQILGFNECIEPFTSNIYTRRTLAGEFIVINKYLMADLKKLDLWNEMMKQQIIARNGSVQGIDLIPESIQRLYKTSWEVKQKTLIDMAAARGAFICQSQSLNLFVADPNYAKLTSMHFYSWKRGLKTGLYYLRTRAPVMAQKFTIDPDLQKAAAKSEMERSMKKLISSDTEECLMCGS
jgi:ribonucleoside-diphosphate reductase alpha subunit